MMKIKYRTGYQYQLADDYVAETGIKLGCPASNRFILLSATGQLIVKQDYAWDGPSGPAIDTDNFMRGSLEHDALYQLIRECLLPASFRIQADQRLRTVCLEDGMSSVRAAWVYHTLRMFGGPASEPRTNETKEAP